MPELLNLLAACTYWHAKLTCLRTDTSVFLFLRLVCMCHTSYHSLLIALFAIIFRTLEGHPGSHVHLEAGSPEVLGNLEDHLLGNLEEQSPLFAHGQ
jgi:hypothetical protein